MTSDTARPHAPAERGERGRVLVRQTTPADFDAISCLTATVYPDEDPWTAEELQGHLDRFAHGQLVAVDRATGEVLGMSASLIVNWDDYEVEQSWRDFTAGGSFDNHDPDGRTLYGAETLVDPAHRRRGVGSSLYEARRQLVRIRGLARIRFGALLSGFHRHADELSARQYVQRVVGGELSDPTLSFQIRQGFRPLALVRGYLPPRRHPRSQGNAVVMEWLNEDPTTRP